MRPAPQVPSNWIWATLGDVLTGIEAGKSFKCDERPPTNGEVGVVKVSAVTWGTFDERASKTCTEPERIDERLFIGPGDFLFSRANTIQLVGACVIVGDFSRRLMLSDKILRLRLRGVVPKWLLYMLRSEWGRSEIERLATGNQESMRNIGQDRIRAIRIPLPPEAEQRRIVAQIESQFTRLDVAVSALERVLRKLNRYRRSVVLSFCARGIKLGDSPQPLNAHAECLDARRVPVNRKERDRRVGPVPYYGANGQVGWIDSHLFDEPLVLVVEDETFVGREKPFAYRIDGKSWVNNHAHVLRPRPGVTAEYLSLALSYYPFIPLTTGSTGRRKLTQAALMNAPLSVPSMDEQAEIVAEIDEALSVADAVATSAEANLKRSVRLRQAILKRAFDGRLVPQDPNDEPAEVLLHRARTNGKPNHRRRAAIEGK